MSKLVIMPNSFEDISDIVSLDINGFILSIKDLSVNSSFYITIEELKKIIPQIKQNNKKIYISLNKNMFNNDLELLENTLKKLNSLNIDKVLFYDLAIPSICQRNKFTLDLVVYQDHLNNSFSSNNFYYNKGITNTFLSNDITYNEVLEIKQKTNMTIFMLVYGYMPISNSRRYLVTNYLKYIENKQYDNHYYLKHNDHYYLIKEENTGTTIYSRDKLNLSGKLSLIKDVDYYVINGFNTNLECLKEVIKNMNKRIGVQEDNYLGFFDTKTIYKVKNNE